MEHYALGRSDGHDGFDFPLFPGLDEGVGGLTHVGSERSGHRGVSFAWSLLKSLGCWGWKRVAGNDLLT